MEHFIQTLDLGQLGMALGAVAMAAMFLRFLGQDRKAFMDVIDRATDAQLAVAEALTAIRQHCSRADRKRPRKQDQGAVTARRTAREPHPEGSKQG
jgi:hypothetical protein